MSLYQQITEATPGTIVDVVDNREEPKRNNVLIAKIVAFSLIGMVFIWNPFVAIFLFSMMGMHLGRRRRAF